MQLNATVSTKYAPNIGSFKKTKIKSKGYWQNCKLRASSKFTNHWVTATSIFYIQSVNHLEKIHEVRLAYWNTLPLLAPVKFRTSYDRRREKVQTEERKSQVQKYYFLTKP